MGDDGVADVQLVDAVDGRDRLDIVVVQAMPGVDDQAEGTPEGHALAYPLQFTGLLLGVFGVGVATGMQFDSRRADPGGGLDLPRIGIDEQRHFAAHRSQASHRVADALFLAGDVEAALGGQFLAALGDQAAMRRPDLLGEGEHFLGDPHLEVHPRLQHFLEHPHVAFLDMPAVLAQVHGDTVGAGFLGVQGGLHRVRIAGAPGLAQGGDVIDVHAEQNSSGFSHGVTPYGS